MIWIGKSWLVSVICFVVLVSVAWKSPLQQRELFYEAFSSGKLEQIDNALAAINPGSGAMTEAFQGALMMRKAGLIKGAGEKLKMFRQGHKIFENEVAKAPQNVELRFIRLCVQEKSPKILKYKGDLEEDKTIIIENFAGLSPEVKKFIMDYAATSSVLTLQDLK